MGAPSESSSEKEEDQQSEQLQAEQKAKNRQLEVQRLQMIKRAGGSGGLGIFPSSKSTLG